MSKFVLGHICYDITFFSKSALCRPLPQQEFDTFCKTLQTSLVSAYTTLVFNATKEACIQLEELENALVADVLDNDRKVPADVFDRINYARSVLKQHVNYDGTSQVKEVLKLWSMCGYSSYLEESGCSFLEQMSKPLSNDNSLNFDAFMALAHLSLAHVMGSLPCNLPYQILELPNTLSSELFREIETSKFGSFPELHSVFSNVSYIDAEFKVYTEEAWSTATWL